MGITKKFQEPFRCVCVTLAHLFSFAICRFLFFSRCTRLRHFSLVWEFAWRLFKLCLLCVPMNNKFPRLPCLTRVGRASLPHTRKDGWLALSAKRYRIQSLDEPPDCSGVDSLRTGSWRDPVSCRWVKIAEYFVGVKWNRSDAFSLKSLSLMASVEVQEGGSYVIHYHMVDLINCSRQAGQSISSVVVL